MKDIVSFEKAKALKRAGIMPPAVEAGQFYYIGGVLFVVLAIKQPYAAVYLCEGSTIYDIVTHVYVNDLSLHHAYAFTPSDLMPLLPKGSSINYQYNLFVVHTNKGPFGGDNLMDMLSDAVLKNL